MGDNYCAAIDYTAMGGDASYVARWYLKMGIFLRIDKLSEY